LKSTISTEIAVIGAGPVGDQRIRAKAFMIATAKRPALPKFFQLVKLPRSIGTLGLGVIDLEMIPAWLTHWRRRCGGVRRLRPCWRCRTITTSIEEMFQSALKDADKQMAANRQEPASARF